MVGQLRVQVGVEPPPTEHVDDAAPDHRSPACLARNFAIRATVSSQLSVSSRIWRRPACRQLVELRLPVVVGDAPARLDPSSLLQPEERGIERALIQLEEAFRHLEDPLGESEPVLRSHRVERPQHHEIEGALQYFCRHSR